MMKSYLYNYQYELECDTIYDLIVNQYKTLREVETLIGLSRTTIRRRIKYMSMYCRRRYSQIQRVLDYNKEFKFRKRHLWQEIDEEVKERYSI